LAEIVTLLVIAFVYTICLIAKIHQKEKEKEKETVVSRILFG
jgi:hypothetical protein